MLKTKHEYTFYICFKVSTVACDRPGLIALSGLLVQVELSVELEEHEVLGWVGHRGPAFVMYVVCTGVPLSK